MTLSGRSYITCRSILAVAASSELSSAFFSLALMIDTMLL